MSLISVGNRHVPSCPKTIQNIQNQKTWNSVASNLFHPFRIKSPRVVKLTFANVTTKIVLSKRLLLHMFTEFLGGLVHAPYTD